MARATRPGVRATRPARVLRRPRPARRPLPRAAQPGWGGPLGHVLHRDLRARSLAERTLAGAADAPLVASAVAATFAGVLADWLHGLLEGTPEEVADQVWQLLVALHMSR